MNFERGGDPLKIMDIGLIHSCHSILEKINGIIFPENSTQSMVNIINSTPWKTQVIHRTLINPFYNIIIGTKGDKFIFLKNRYENVDENQEMDLKELYDKLLKYNV